MVLPFSLASVYHLAGVLCAVHVQGCAARNRCVSTLVVTAAGTPPASFICLSSLDSSIVSQWKNVWPSVCRYWINLGPHGSSFGPEGQVSGQMLADGSSRFGNPSVPPGGVYSSVPFGKTKASQLWRNRTEGQGSGELGVESAAQSHPSHQTN